MRVRVWLKEDMAWAGSKLDLSQQYGVALSATMMFPHTKSTHCDSAAHRAVATVGNWLKTDEERLKTDEERSHNMATHLGIGLGW